MNTQNTAVVLLQESLVTDASTIRLGSGYQVFYQTHQQGGSRGLVTLVRKDSPATLTEKSHNFGVQVDTLCITLHLGRTYKLDVYTVYCRQRSHLDLLPLLEDPKAEFIRDTFSGQWPPLKNGHHSVAATDEVSVIMDLMKVAAVKIKHTHLFLHYHLRQESINSCYFYEIYDYTDLISGRHRMVTIFKWRPLTTEKCLVCTRSNTKLTLLSGNFNAQHPLLEPWKSGAMN